MKKFTVIFMALAFLLALASVSMAGINNRFSDIYLGDSGDARNAAVFPERAAPTGDPPTNTLWIYVKDSAGVSALYAEGDDGVVHSLTPSATALDDITNPDGATDIDLTTYPVTFTSAVITAHSMTIENTGAFNAAEGVLKLEQKTGNPDGGQLLYMTMVDTHVDGAYIYHSLAALTAETILLKLGFADDDDAFGIYIRCLDDALADTVFQVGQGGDVIISETTLIDEDNIYFTAAGEVTLGDGAALTLNPGGGDAAGEDLIITAHNIQLTAGGEMTLSPDGAVTTAIDATDTDFTNALSVDASNIIGTTGLITYTNWDIAADGDATFVDVTVGGNISIVGTFQQDNLVPASASPQAITLNAGTTGKVQIANISTGNVEFGAAAGAGATTVDLVASTNLVISEGDVAITSTADEDLLTIIGNAVVNNKGISVTMDGITGGSMLYLDNNQAGAFTGKYVQLFDGTQDDFSIKLHGIMQAAGSAGNDSWILDTGDLIVTAGDLDLDAGMITVLAALNTDQSSFANSGDVGAVGAGEAYFTIKGSIAGGNTTQTAHLLELVYNADGDTQDAFLVLKDNAYANIKFSVGAGAATAWNLDDVIIAIDADTVAQTGTAGVIDMNVRSATAANVGFMMDYELDDGGSATQYGFQLSLQDDGAGGDELFVAFDALVSGGTNATTTAFQAVNYTIALKTTSLAADTILDVDVATAYTARGFDIDLGDHVGTVDEGFIHIFTDADTTDVAGQILRIDLQDSTVDTTEISGKAIYAKEVSAYKADSYLVHFESTNNGSIYALGDIDVVLSANTDFLKIVANAEGASGYAAGAGVLTIYDDSTGQNNTSYLFRGAREAAADAQNGFLLFQDASDGTAGNGTDQLKIDYMGSIIMGGATTTGGNIVSSFTDVAANSDGVAMDILTLSTFVTTNNDGDEDAFTLANGTVGQIKIVVSDVEGGAGDSYKITPASANGWTKITFDAAPGDGCILMYTSNGWVIIANNGGVIT